jgi:hypothetical protein
MLNLEGVEVLQAWLNERSGAGETRLERLGNLFGKEPKS